MSFDTYPDSNRAGGGHPSGCDVKYKMTCPDCGVTLIVSVDPVTCSCPGVTWCVDMRLSLEPIRERDA